MASKKSDSLENLIDAEIIDIGRKMFPLFRLVGLTANGLTTISLILGLGSCYNFIINSISFLHYCIFSPICLMF